MKPHARIGLAARRDIIEIFAFIGGDHPAAARRFMLCTRQTVAALAHMPQMGALRLWTSKHLRDVRFHPVNDFEKILIYYRPIKNGVEILRVLHSSRDVLSLFE